MKPNQLAGICLCAFIVLGVVSDASSQQSVAIGDANPKTNAVLYLKGNGSQGLIIPVVTTTGSFGEAGMVVYNSTDKKIYYHDGTSWTAVGGGSAGGDAVVGNEVTSVGTTGGLVLSGAGTTADPLRISLVSGTSTGQVLKWNGTTGKWEPGTDNTGTVALNSSQILVGNASNVATAVTLSGAGQLSNTGVLTLTTGSVNAATILDASIANADIAPNAAITASKLGQSGATTNQVLKWNGTAWAPADDNTGSVSLNASQILVGNASNVATAVTVSGDATLSSAGALTIGTGAVNSAKILDGSIANADIATNAAIAPSKLAQGGATNDQVLKWNGTAWAPAADNAGTVALNSGQILVGNASNVPTAVTVSGDGTVSNAGVLTIGTGAVNSAKILDASIVNADIATNAAIAPSKLGQSGATNDQVLKWNGTAWAPANDGGLSSTLNSGQILVGSSTNVATAVTASGDATISNTGAITIATGAVESTKILDGSVASADIADATVTSTDISNNTITNADINAAAAIAGTKISPDFGAQNITTTGGTTTGALTASGAVSFNALTGTGTRMVVADNTGLLSTQSIPASFSTLNVIPKGNGTTLTSSLLYDDGANIGLGTTAPAYPLDIHKGLVSGTDANLRVYNPSNTDGDKSGIRFGVGSFWAVHLNTALNGNWLELTDNSGSVVHRWTYDSYYPGPGTSYIRGTGLNLALMGGFIGIGTDTPDRKLEVSSSNYQVGRFYSTNAGAGLELVSETQDDWMVTSWSGLLYLTHSSNNFSSQADQFYFSTTTFAPFQDGTKTLGASGNRWTAVYSLNGTIQTSDIRLKSNVADLKYGLNEVLKLRPVFYSWKTDLKKRRVGFIAQEVQEIVPEVVVNEDDNLGMNYGELVPVLVNAIQEQQLKINALEEKIKKLEAENSELTEVKAEIAEIKKALGMTASSK
jgi:hypothetical protein